jgi:isoquinoline 1-oxidoreductase beta subunit
VKEATAMNETLLISRRKFLAASAGFTFAFTLPLAGATAEEAKSAGRSLRPNAWIRIEPDGGIVILSGISELGQGSMTALALVVAEDLDADWSHVRIEMSPAIDKLYGNPQLGNRMLTIASYGVVGYYTALRLAGAQARASLLLAAAAHWKVPAAELSTEPSTVVHQASGRRLSYGEIAAAVENLPQPPELKESDLKPATSFRLIGKDVLRRDLPAKIDGNADYAGNIRLPGLVYATVLRAPVLGATVERLDSAATDVKGVSDVRRLGPDAVAVVGSSMAAVLEARERVRITWSSAPADAFNDRASIDSYLAIARDSAQPGRAWDKKGDTAAALAKAARTVEREYRSDYFYHAQIEPLTAVASVTEGGKRVQVWAGTQAPAYAVTAVARALGVPEDAVQLHRSYSGGAFGRRAAYDQDYVVDAARLSRDIGKPVKVIWSRKEDVQSGRFKPMTGQWLRAAIGAGNDVVAWHHRVACEDPLMMADPPRYAARKESPAVAMLGTNIPSYNVPNQLVEFLRQPIVVRVAPMRGVGAPPNRFAVESFVDEVALELKIDPLEMRRRLLANTPRGLRVLERAAKMASWGSAEPGRAKGIAFSDYGGTMLAAVAEVSAERASGVIRVHRMWAAFDPGLTLQPDNAVALMEGGLVFGLSMALKEQITFANGRVEQSHFFDYPVLRMNEAPDVQVELMASDVPPAGIGEAAPIVAPAAVANAFASLTGRRIRHMPLVPDRVRAALA